MGDFGEVRHPVAAKEHRCEWCGEPIPKGEKHAHFVGKWENEFQNWRMHYECHDYADDTICEGFTPYEHERPPLRAQRDPGFHQRRIG